MPLGKYQADRAYFPSRLKKKLKTAIKARSLLIEAPSGYGKTTAVEDFLRPHLPEDALYERHVCHEETPASAWRRFCRALGRLSPEAGEALTRLGPPDRSTQGEAAAILMDMDADAPAWLVLDDFQLLRPAAPDMVWKAFLEHEAQNFHLIIITQPVGPALWPRPVPGLFLLGPEDLALTEEETAEYFIKAGAPLPPKLKGQLWRRTEGWIMALSLHLRHFLETGQLAPAADFSGLLREMVWDRFSGAAQEMLLALSPFESFSPAQALDLTAAPAFPSGEALAELEDAAFLRLDPASGLYHPHHALLAFTRKVFGCLPKARRRRMLKAAAAWCAENGRREKAVDLYYQLRDFENILSLDLGGIEDDHPADGLAYAEMFLDIAAHADEKMRGRHPMSMIQIAFELFGQGRVREAEKLGRDMERLMERVSCSEAEREHLRGELLLMEAFQSYNDLEAMGARAKEAWALMDERPSLIALSNSWTFGNASPLWMYHRAPGGLEKELADMDEGLGCYLAMTRGHGAGGAALMRAEALLTRGRGDETEMYGFKARSEAGQNRQLSVLIGADLFFGRLALLRGEGAGLAAALGSLKEKAELAFQKSDRLEAEMAAAFLLQLIGRHREAAEWLREGDFEKRLFAPALPYAQMLLARHYILEDRPELWLGLADSALGLAGALNCGLALIYGHIHSAAAWLKRGERKKAASELAEALALARPDGLWLPFAETRDLIEPLWGKVETDESLVALALKFAEGRRAASRALAPCDHPFGLSDREKEAAELVLGGFSKQEAAEKMGVSINTVKAHIKAAYRKSGAANRAGLRKLLCKS